MKGLSIVSTVLFVLFSFNLKFVHGQSSSTGVGAFPNTPAAGGEFLGWATGALTAGYSELTVKTDDPLPISFYTNAGGGLGNMRMWIYEDITNASAANAGYVGIGNFVSAGATPQHLLHLHFDDDVDVFEQFTNKNTIYTATDGFLVGINYAGSYLGGAVSIAKLIQQENGPMKFYTGSDPGGANSGAPLARMIINSDYFPDIHGVIGQNTSGYVGIGTFDPNAPLGPSGFWEEEIGSYPYSEGPRSLLHMQGPFNAYNNGGNGWRGWMKTGIYINENSDEMYIGLKNEFDNNGDNRSDAVIMWGDDQLDPDAGLADCFRLIFSGNSTGLGTGTPPLQATSYDGLETMRMTPFGRMGVGPLFTFNVPPARRLELLDYQNPNSSSMDEPQLRLTFEQATPGSLSNTGIWTDFQASSAGDLHIFPRDAGVARRVGINWATGAVPYGTLHVNSESASLMDLVLSKSNDDAVAFFQTTALGDLGIATFTTNPSITARFVGIHTTTPDNTLEITSNPSQSPEPAGLRFTNLTNGTAPITNPDPQKGVLSVDNDGDVIFVVDEDNGGTGTGNVIDCGTVTTNYVPYWSNGALKELCNSDIYDDYANHFVGISNTGPNAKLDVDGDIKIKNTANVYRLGDYRIMGHGTSGSTFLAGRDAGGEDRITTGIHHIPDGTDNTAVGFRAGYNLPCPTCTSTNPTYYNTLLGSTAGFNVTSTGGSNEGNDNTFVGAGSGYYASTGQQNVAVGYQAGGGFTAGAAIGAGGNYNSSLGYRALTANTTGDYNAAIGFSAMLGNTSGENNSAVGNNAGSTITTGQYNSFLGSGANATNNNSTYRSAIGAGTSVSVNDCIAIGRSGHDRVVIAGTAPTGGANALTVFGNTDISGTSRYMINNNSWSWQQGTNNTFLGFQSNHTALTSGTDNTCIGQSAGPALTSGSVNSFLGVNAGLANTSGGYNTFLGTGAGKSNTVGLENIMIGNNAGEGQTDHSYNIFIGNEAGGPMSYNFASGANENTYIGHASGKQLDGHYNTVLGANAFNSSGFQGNNNTFIGRSSSSGAATVNDCVLLVGGSSSLSPPSATSITNATAIGANSSVSCNDCMVLGSIAGGSINQVHVGIGYTNPTGDPTPAAHGNFLLYVNSEVDADTAAGPANSAYFNGRVCALGIWTFSDSILKSNVQPLPPNVASDIIDNLNPKTYTYNTQSNPQLHLPGGVQAGLIADEVEQILPELVAPTTVPAELDSNGNIISPALTFKTLNYTGLIPYLIQGMKDQNQKLDDLTNQIAVMQSQLDNCCENGERQINPNEEGNTKTIDVKLSNAKGIILRQNQPNPFSEQTLITYFITDEVQKAQIYFFDNKGIVLKIVDIDEKGEGQLNVYASDLSSGSYTYSLIADGKLIETKKMVKTN